MIRQKPCWLAGHHWWESDFNKALNNPRVIWWYELGLSQETARRDVILSYQFSYWRDHF